MARSTPVSHRPTGHNGNSLPPYTGGGDDGRNDNDRGSGDSMPNYGQRLRHARLALMVFMAPILMLFVSFTVVYMVRRGFVSFDVTSDTYIRTWVPVRLPWAILLANTFILILSTVTIDLARRAITREAALAPIKSIPGVTLGDERSVPWLAFTTVLGLLFLAGQLFAWRQLSAGGFHLLGGTSSSFVYILTAMHGIHLAGGIVALTFANVAAVLDRPVESRRIVVDITAWYWHFMTGLWIYILVLFAFAAR
ncbi:MAG TPA: cytochrome c oxidase subunit 3 [Terriglobales bacterium]|jgi:cytochrome c oxidase subunit 3|nr:cytochrome c oxidase subunit 3 [Terriglobales bacterium]